MSINQLVILMILCWGIGSFIFKFTTNSIHPLMVNLILDILYCILGIFTWSYFKFDTRVNASGLIITIIGGILYFIAVICYFTAIQKGDVGQITILVSVYPVLTLILSMIFLGERLTLSKFVGIILVGLGLFFLSKK